MKTNNTLSHHVPVNQRPEDFKENGVAHGCICLEAGTLLDLFTPCREDFLKQNAEDEI